MRKKKKETWSNMWNFIKTFVIVFLIILTINIVGTGLEILINPWVKSGAHDFHWWNIFTTNHGLAILFYKSKVTLLVITLVIALMITFKVTKK